MTHIGPDQFCRSQ